MRDRIAGEIRKQERAKVGALQIRGNRFKLASLGRRWLGAGLDFMISLVTVSIGIGVGNGLVAFIVLVTGSPIDDWIGNLIGIVLCPLVFAYPLLRDGLPGGASLGKRVMKTRVIDEKTGAPCTYGHSFGRNFFGILVSLIPPGIFDVAFMLGRKNQRLGDKVAHTLVVMRDGEEK